MKRHQIVIITRRPGKTWASCLTCGKKSKQSTTKASETWMAEHQDKVTTRDTAMISTRGAV